MTCAVAWLGVWPPADCVAAQAPALAQTWAAAAIRGDAAALAQLLAAVDIGNAQAQAAYAAYCLHNGRPYAAANWFAQAAAQGDAQAQYRLAGLYAEGIGVPRDPRLAQRWLQRAAALGDPDARRQLGAGAAVGATPQSAPRSAASTSPHGATVALAVQGWAHDWAAKDLPAYFAAYLPGYAPAGQSHAAWLAARRARIATAAPIMVSVDDLQVEHRGDAAIAHFTEHYRRAAVHFVGAKTMRLQWQRGRWLIAQER